MEMDSSLFRQQSPRHVSQVYLGYTPSPKLQEVLDGFALPGQPSIRLRSRNYINLPRQGRGGDLQHDPVIAQRLSVFSRDLARVASRQVAVGARVGLQALPVANPNHYTLNFALDPEPFRYLLDDDRQLGALALSASDGTSQPRVEAIARLPGSELMDDKDLREAWQNLRRQMGANHPARPLWTPKSRGIYVQGVTLYDASQQQTQP